MCRCPAVPGSRTNISRTSSSFTQEISLALVLIGNRKSRGSFSWDEDVLERRVKDLLTQRAVETARYYWSETGGGIMGVRTHE